MKKILLMMLAFAVIVSAEACLSRPKVATDSDKSETTSSDQDESAAKRDEDQSADPNLNSQGDSIASPTGESPKLADADEAEVKAFIQSQLEANAAGLQDYVKNTPFAAAMTGQPCSEDEDPVYIGGYLAVEPILNRWISDPVVGDQRNFLYIIKADAENPKDLSLAHLQRDNTRIEYTLEDGESYQLIVYLQNNVRYDEKNPDAGAIENLSLAVSVPLATYSGIESRLVTIVGGENTVQSSDCEIALTSKEKAQLIWNGDISFYDMNGKHTKTASLNQLPNAHYVEEDEQSATIDMLAAEHYSAGSMAFLGFGFTVAAE